MRKRRMYKILSCAVAVAMTVCTVTPWNVQAAKKKKMALNVKSLVLQTGESKKLKVKGISKKKIKSITWSSKKKKVAKVKKSGKVTAISTGKTTILCRVKLKNGKKYSLKCKVTVKENNNASGDNVVIPSDTATPSETGVTTNTTIPSVTPQITQIPSTSSVPSESKTPSESIAPSESQAPLESDKPSESVAPSDSATPSESTVPSESVAPSVSQLPLESTVPSVSAVPSASITPTNHPVVSLAPIASTTPGEVHLSKNGIETTDDGVMRTQLTAFDMIHNMGVGINLGNTMESCGNWISNSSVTNYEQAWGAPVTTQKMITGMKNAGFNSIRIPVAWSNMMAEDGNYTISEAYFNRVETIMNYALNEKMYVIINIHFDGGWWARFGSTVESEREEAMKKYKSMWTQIANRYSEYSDYLIFESANEELGHRLNSTEDYAGSGYFESVDEVYEMMNLINQTFVDIVRESGGNNATRHLLIAGYDTDIDKTCDSRFVMPTDTLESRLMVSVHYYTPATYCLVDKVDNTWGYASTWGTQEEIAALQNDLKKMKVTFVNKGYPVIIGEYGVCDTVTGDEQNGYTYTRKEGRDLFIEAVCRYAVSNGMCPVLWSTPGHIYDRETCKIENDIEAALYLELKEYAQSCEIFEPEEFDGEYVWRGTISNSGWNPQAPVADEDCDFVMSQTGGCYTISGIDWSAYETPVLQLEAGTLSGSVGYQIAKTLNTTNEYWTYIEVKDIEGSWSTEATKMIDLSPLGYSSKENLYIMFTGMDFEGTVTLTIKEKE